LEQIQAVRDVLSEIDADRVPELLVFNKSDRAPDEAKVLADRHPGSVVLSARTGEGVDELLRAVADRIRTLTAAVELLVPYGRGDLLAAVHREGEVLAETHEEGGIRVRARLDDAGQAKFVDLRM
jgi:GTP-binding protein HflX